MLNNKKIFLYLCIFSLSIFLPFTVHGETHVYQEDVKKEWTWNEAGSPYILENRISIPSGNVLNINQGVEVRSATVDEGNEPNTIFVNGTLNVNGSKDKPVKFLNLFDLYFGLSESNIRNAIFSGTGLNFNRSTTTIDSVRITDSSNAITAIGSRVDIASSTFLHNDYGITSYLYFPVFQVKAPDALNSVYAMGGIGNALDDFDHTQNIITIHNSSILENKYSGIINQTLNPIDATLNWWGRKTGPNPSETFGSVDANPWIEKDPNIIEDNSCCSNVLFIPGIEASRLYKDTKGTFGTTTNKLWEPLSNEDVKKMYMNPKGQSLDQTIYTKDIIDAIPGIKNIYRTFMDSMDGLVTSNKINTWSAFPYDWRKSATDVVDQNLLSKVYDLASKSKTGKVVIIAHSNGGLVAKTLMKKLEEIHKSELIENIIFIAVPELGTPEAVLSLLHGYNQSIFFDLILSENNARTFSQNMPGAYGLLPSKKLFEKNPITIISDLFSGNKFVSSFEGMKSFLLNNPFSKISSTDTNIPLILNSYLLSLNNSIHSQIDSWKNSSSTKTLSIFGWGMPTSHSVTYVADPHCSDREVREKICPVAFSPILDNAGDGTVITKSNSGNADSTLFFNLKELKKDTYRNIQHANILESGALLAKVKDTITHTEPVNPSYSKYFSTTEPEDTDKYLTIRVYSPVDIDVYDKDGHHTGPIYDTRTNRYVSDEENNIIGGYYRDFGRVKLTRVPYDIENQIILSGNDSGVFSIVAEISQGDRILASTTFSELPVTPLTNIDFIVGSSTESFASSSIMQIDVDSDGTADIVGHSDTYLHSSTTDLIKDLPAYLESMRKVIISLKLPALAEKNWLNRIDKIVKIAEKKNYKKIEKITKRFSNKKIKNRKLTENQRTAVLKTFEGLLKYLEDKHNI